MEVYPYDGILFSSEKKLLIHANTGTDPMDQRVMLRGRIAEVV